MPITIITCLPTLSTRWQPWQQAPFLPECITIFRLKTTENAAVLAQWERLLTPDEQQRGTKFRRRDDQNRFVLGRGLARLIIGQINNEQPQQVVIERSYAGKPFLPALPNCQFSVSHTGDWVLLAVGAVPLGVDVEFINQRFEFDDLIPTVLSRAEQFALTNSPDKHLFFYECWTRKEAFVKATGAGITDNFVNIPTLEAIHRVDSGLIGEHGAWAIQPFFVDDAYVAALVNDATEGEKSLRFYEIDPAMLS
jgi:4'-phosphopantetheinyl transferase